MRRNVVESCLNFFYFLNFWNRQKTSEMVKNRHTVNTRIKTQGKKKFWFIFKTTGTLKWSNLNDQKISHISEFVIRVNKWLYKNQICLKTIPTFLFYPWVLFESLRLSSKNNMKRHNWSVRSFSLTSNDVIENDT